ncbi:MAG: 50S ribosomal protein L28 [Planctomycetes bacterium]|nr:50S ribosomal protein L28 [Planctomycetota bacterium]
MSFKCEICGKGPVAGRTYTQRGIAIKKGGVGLKTTGVTKRRFLPNVQKVRAKLESGSIKTMKVCTCCIRSGRVTKAR